MVVRTRLRSIVLPIVLYLVLGVASGYLVWLIARLDQESLIVGLQQQAQLRRCMASLPTYERLLLQLRFEGDLSLDEIARLTGLGDAQRVHRHIGVILKSYGWQWNKNAEKLESCPCNMSGTKNGGYPFLSGEHG